MYSVYPIDLLHVYDNYAWTLTPAGSNKAYVVDPGAAEPVARSLKSRGLTLAGILLTHHHWDHVDGVAELVDGFKVPVWGPEIASVPQISQVVGEGDSIQLEGIRLQVLSVPGHTAEHIAYYTEDAGETGNSGDKASPALFCGDTLFAGGCGRVLGGTTEELHLSLSRLARLPPETLIYCAHEYTVANLTFAQAVEPDNVAARERLKSVRALRDKGLPSLPSQLQLELATNPFLRGHIPNVVHCAEQHAGRSLSDTTEVFSVLRRWKDSF